MTQPLIGITSGYRTIELKYLHSCLSRRYTQAVISAGGIPLIIPANLPEKQWNEMMLKFDGILLSGGDDVNPTRYGEVQIPETKKVLDERDELEIRLLRHALSNGKPLLGICRGMQLVNVGMGGSLYQHIITQHPGAIQHDRHDDHREKRHHQVTIDEESLLKKITSQTVIKVNTLHHQGIKIMGEGIIASAVCGEDGLVEAIEAPDHPFLLAVQWHPEELTDHPEQQALFDAFVKACQKR